ncbi:MAG TPA: hypothetical protein VFM51_06500 [Solirubrobacterales bacterium]|nr:hypothetical protein [Solirubrobacterales bacterium]
MKRLTLLALVALLALAPAAAQARPGALDPSFGRDGRVTVKLPVKELEFFYPEKPRAARIAMDALPRGGFVAASGPFLIERRSNGLPRRSFGADGRVSLGPPPGWMFELADLAVDSEGRVLVAGTLASLTVSRTQDPVAYNEGRDAHGPQPRLAVVYRFLPDGSRDQSFDGDGVLIGTFGQRPPTGPGPFDYEYSTPAVGLTGLALAPDGDLVLSGYAAAHVTGGCSPSAALGATSRSFLARLRPDGSLDPSFGSGGTVTNEQLEQLTPPSITGSGRIGFDGASGGYCWPRGEARSGTLVSLLANGQPDPRFGENGGVRHPNLSEITAVSFDSVGRLLVVGHGFEAAVHEGGIANPKWRVRRLLTNGRPDPKFGRNGSASPKVPPRAVLRDVTIDHRGRIVLAGYVADRAGRNNRFLLTRLTSAGRRQPRFGRRGWATTAFPAGEAAGLEVAVDLWGRLLVGGVLGNPESASNGGLAFARYLSG